MPTQLARLYAVPDGTPQRVRALAPGDCDSRGTTPKPKVVEALTDALGP